MQMTQELLQKRIDELQAVRRHRGDDLIPSNAVNIAMQLVPRLDGDWFVTSANGSGGIHIERDELDITIECDGRIWISLDTDEVDAAADLVATAVRHGIAAEEPTQ